jgi:glutamate-1-semialdehyde 2,1-aminomutase
LEDETLPWAVYESYSGFQFFLNPGRRPIRPTSFLPRDVPWTELNWNPRDLAQKLRLAMLVNGIQLTNRPGGLASAVHSQQDMAETVNALRKSLRLLRSDGTI